MGNPLLEVLTTSPNRVYDVTDNYLRNVAIEDFKAHILDLLERQREKCHENAFIVNEGTYGSDGQSMEYYVVDRDSILNAKLF
jgi:hypothetical protein